MGGGLNAGISTVRTKDNPFGRVYIEKAFAPKDIEDRIAHKEMVLLHQVGDHPYITTMFDHFVDENARKACIYMEFCDMGSLMDVIEKSNGYERVSEHKVWNWFIQLMEALVYCHRGANPIDEMEVFNWATIYHRDIKPPNCLLTRDKEKTKIIAKLADFGCAQSDEWTHQTKPESWASHASAVTPGFDQPEYPKFSGSSDVWQLALVFVCVCTLDREGPRSKQNPRGKQWDRDWPAGPHYSKELSQILKWCLTEDMKKRPGALEVLKKLKAGYNSIKDKLPPDTQPLEIFDRAGRQSLQVPFLGSRQQMSSPRYANPMPRSEVSDPEAGRSGRMANNYADLMGGQRSPQGPFPGGHPLDGPRNLWEDSFEDQDDDPLRLYEGLDPRLLGGFHPHQEYYPPFHRRYDPRYGRRC